MQTTIIIDDNDRNELPLAPWTANIQDEDGEMLAEAGLGATRREALLDLLENIDREFPNFADLA